MIRRLDEKNFSSNPYLQPFEPNAFFPWIEGIKPPSSEIEHSTTINAHTVELSPFVGEITPEIETHPEPVLHPPKSEVFSEGNIQDIHTVDAYDNAPLPLHHGLPLPNQTFENSFYQQSLSHLTPMVQDVSIQSSQPGIKQDETSQINFTNHPLFPPFPMNEEQWQQYHQNPRPPLNPSPSNPYPSISKVTKETKSVPNHPISNFLTHFKSVDGSYDFPKIMNTAGSMVNSMNQISSIVKSIGGFFLGGSK